MVTQSQFPSILSPNFRLPFEGCSQVLRLDNFDENRFHNSLATSAGIQHILDWFPPAPLPGLAPTFLDWSHEKFFHPEQHLPIHPRPQSWNLDIVVLFSSVHQKIESYTLDGRSPRPPVGVWKKVRNTPRSSSRQHKENEREGWLSVHGTSPSPERQGQRESGEWTQMTTTNVHFCHHCAPQNRKICSLYRNQYIKLVLYLTFRQNIKLGAKEKLMEKYVRCRKLMQSCRNQYE